jgi:hypothetical protein
MPPDLLLFVHMNLRNGVAWHGTQSAHTRRHPQRSEQQNPHVPENRTN